jgi:hypothetical protein
MDGLSERPPISRIVQESFSNLGGLFFGSVSFGHTKEMNSPQAKAFGLWSLL